MSLFSDLVDRKIIRILTSLVNHPTEHFHIQKLSSVSRVPLSSTFRIVNNLVKIGLVDVIVVGKFKIYRLSEKKKKELTLLVKVKG